MKESIVRIQVLQTFFLSLISLLVANKLFVLDLKFTIILAICALSGLLAAVWTVVIFNRAKGNGYDGAIDVNTEAHTMSLRIDGSIDDLIKKGEVNLEVNSNK